MGRPTLFFDVGADMAPLLRGLDSVAARAGSLVSYAVTGALAGIGTAIVATGVGSVNAAAQMETYETTLTSLMGSASAASKRMDELVTAAARTPFNLDQIVEAEINLQGLTDASDRLLPGVIDVASAMQSTGYTVQQAAVDMGKAWTQGAAGMEGDTAKIIKQMVSIDAGVDATSLSLDEFREHLLHVLDEGKFAGSAAKLSATFSGMVSNLQDSWASFLRDVARSSDLFNNIKGVLALTLDEVDKNKDAIKALAVVVGDNLWQGFRLVAQGAAFVGDTIRSGVGTAYALAAAIDTSEAAIRRTQAATLELAGALLDAAGGNGAKLRDAATILQIDTEKAAARAEEHGRKAAEMRVGELAYYDLVTEKLNAAEAAAKAFGEETTKDKKKSTPVSGKDGGDTSEVFDEQKMLDAINAYAKFYDELQHMRDSDVQKLDAWQQEQLDKAKQLTDAMLGNDEDYAALKLGVDQEYYGRLKDLSDGYYKQLVDQEHEANQARVRQRQQFAAMIIDDTGSLLGSLAGMMDQANAKEKAAYKALMIAKTIMSTASAIQGAFQQWGWPQGLVPAAFITAQGAIEIATIASAHQGYAPPGVAPDERITKTLTDEAVLSRQTTRELGPQGVHDLEFGAPATSGGYTLRIGRAQWREMIRMDTRTGGPLSQQISAPTRSQIAPGMTGLRAA